MFLEECLEKEPRTYNSVQLAQKLEQERSVKLSSDWLRQVLKKKESQCVGETLRCAGSQGTPLGGFADLFALSVPVRVSVSVRRRVATGVVIWKRTFNSHKGKQNPVVQLLKQADLEMLELSAAGTRNRFKIDTASLRENAIIP